MPEVQKDATCPSKSHPRETSVAVIIVNWKVRDLLRECLQSVRDASGWDPAGYEVIVVDNNSGDGSVEMVHAEFPGVRLVANSENTGFGAANNLALSMTTASRIVLLNPDTVVRRGALAAMVNELEANPSVAILGCKLLNRDGSLQRWTAGAFPTLANVTSHYFFLNKLLPKALRPAPLYLESDLQQATDIGWISGACMAIRRESLDGELFDKRFFMYAEDMELCFRLSKKGWRIRYDPSIAITHYQGASLQQQKSEIMLSSLKCPRHFFEILHGSRAAAIFDYIVVAGFGMRWVANSLAGALSSNSAFKKRAESSRTYLNLALHVMRDAKGHPLS